MANLTSVVNVNVDSNLKNQANEILNDLGLNMSTAINMFLKQIVKRDGIPFEVTNPKPSKEMLHALEESEKIIKEIREGRRTGYDNMSDLISSLDEEH